MKIRKEPDLRGKPASFIAVYLADRWAGRAICANDLRTIYGLDDETVRATMQALVKSGVTYNPHHSRGRDNIVSYRIRAHG